jgi:hypothetical protein
MLQRWSPGGNKLGNRAGSQIFMFQVESRGSKKLSVVYIRKSGGTWLMCEGLPIQPWALLRVSGSITTFVQACKHVPCVLFHANDLWHTCHGYKRIP